MWRSSVEVLVVVVSVLEVVWGQQDATGSEQVYPSFPGEENPDIAFPPEDNNPNTDLGDINWNETVDYLLSLANNRTDLEGHDEIPLPDIDEQFSRRVGPINLRGEFKANQGRLKGLASFRRTGDVTVARRGASTFTMTCPVGLRDVTLRYDHYRVKVRRGPSVSGNIEGEVGANSIAVTASIDVTDTACTTTLDEVKVTELSGLKVRVGGLGPPLDQLMSAITMWLTEVFRGDLVKNLERALKRELTRGLARSRCEKFAGYFIFVNPK